MRTTLLAAVLPVLSGCLLAQSMAVVVDAGPLVCLSTNGLAHGNHEVTLHLAAIAGDGPARPFWRNRDNANVLARLDRDHLLVASYGTPCSSATTGRA